MANCRKKGKKKITFWLTDAEIGVLKEEGAVEGLNMTDVIRQQIILIAKKRGVLRHETEQS